MDIYKAIPGAKFVVFEKSGHLPSYEEPDKYVKVVDALLSEPLRVPVPWCAEVEKWFAS